MEKAIITCRPNSLILEQLKEMDYLYFGNEFCEYLIPTLAELKHSYTLAMAAGVKYVLVTPYSNEAGMNLIKEDIKWLIENAEEFDIVCNDWGVFNYCVNIGLSKRLIIGRILNKMYRDIRIKLEKENLNVNLYNSLKDTPLLSSQYIDLWEKYNIKRIEFDNLLQGFDERVLIKCKLQKSVYYPYIYLTTSRLCPHNESYWENGAQCERQCVEECFEFSYGKENILLYEYGRTVFLKNDSGMENIEKFFDRIVYEPEIPH